MLGTMMAKLAALSLALFAFAALADKAREQKLDFEGWKPINVRQSRDLSAYQQQPSNSYQAPSSVSSAPASVGAAPASQTSQGGSYYGSSTSGAQTKQQASSSYAAPSSQVQTSSYQAPAPQNTYGAPLPQQRQQQQQTAPAARPLPSYAAPQPQIQLRSAVVQSSRPQKSYRAPLIPAPVVPTHPVPTPARPQQARRLNGYASAIPQTSYAAPAPAVLQQPNPSYAAPVQQLSSSSARQPQTGYGAPAVQQQPQTSYSAPTQQQPQNSFAAPAQQPQTSYSAPVQQPQSSYSAPAQQQTVQQPQPIYSAPQQPQIQTSYSAPAQQQSQNTYSAPQQQQQAGFVPITSPQETYSAPQQAPGIQLRQQAAPQPQTSYSAPAARPQQAYSAPQQQQLRPQNTYAAPRPTPTAQQPQSSYSAPRPVPTPQAQPAPTTYSAPSRPVVSRPQASYSAPQQPAQTYSAPRPVDLTGQGPVPVTEDIKSQFVSVDLPIAPAEPKKTLPSYPPYEPGQQHSGVQHQQQQHHQQQQQPIVPVPVAPSENEIHQEQPETNQVAPEQPQITLREQQPVSVASSGGKYGYQQQQQQLQQQQQHQQDEIRETAVINQPSTGESNEVVPGLVIRTGVQQQQHHEANVQQVHQQTGSATSSGPGTSSGSGSAGGARGPEAAAPLTAPGTAPATAPAALPAVPAAVNHHSSSASVSSGFGGHHTGLAIDQRIDSLPKNVDLLTMARAIGGVETFLSLVQEADLVETLSGPGPFTVFVPTDEAFGVLPSTLMSDLSDDKDRLREVLLNHVVADQRALSTDFAERDNVVAAEGGKPLRVNVYQLAPSTPKIFTVNGARVLKADVVGSNGVIHFVNRVLYPSAEKNIVDLMFGCKEFEGVVNLLIETNTLEQLSGPGPFTIFAPSNGAINSFKDAIDKLVSEDRDKAMSKVLYHLVNGTFFSEGLYDRQYLVTAMPERLPVSCTVTTDTFFKRLMAVNENRIIRPDIVATNGVIHLMDGVLNPESGLLQCNLL